MLTSALIYGLSAAVPPLGAVAIPAYMTYNYSKPGYNLYKVYDELQSKGKVGLSSVTQASGSLGEFVTRALIHAVIINTNVLGATIEGLRLTLLIFHELQDWTENNMLMDIF